MSTLNSTFSLIVLKFYELTHASLFQVDAENGRLTWWGGLLILGLIILVIVLALAWNASKTSVPEVEHSSHDRHEVIKTPATPALSSDDLTKIEGIGPKIASLLRENGITTFDQLRNADLNVLGKILENARLQFSDPTSWPEQAGLAARGDWKALAALQENLKGGRRQS